MANSNLPNVNFSRDWKLTGVTRQNGEIFLVFDHEKLVQPTLEILLDVLTPDQFRKIFGIVLVDNRFYVVDKKNNLKFDCDLNDTRIHDMFGLTEQKLKILKKYSKTSIDKLIPDELKDQYCLVDDKGTVVFNSYSYKDIQIAHKLFGLTMTEYHPPNR